MENIDFGAIYTMLLGMYLPGLITVAVGLVFFGVKQAWGVIGAFIKQHLSDKQQAFLASAVREGVFAAEQIWNRPDVQNAAALKRQEAFNYVDDKLKSKGITMSASQIYSMIEAAVYTELNQWKQYGKPGVEPGPDTTIETPAPAA